MLILNSDHVKSVLTMKDCMDALEEAYRENALGRTVNHRRTHLHMTVSKPDRLYRFKTMPGGIEKLWLLAIRLNSDMMTWPVVDGKRRQVKVAAAPGNRFVGQILLYNAEDIRVARDDVGRMAQIWPGYERVYGRESIDDHKI